MKREESYRAIMFTDLTGSTFEWYVNFLRMEKHIRSYISIIEEKAKKHEGITENFTGDGFMLSFANVATAICCAFDIHMTWGDYRKKNNMGEKLKVRIGIHYGLVLRLEDNKLIGDATNMAKRIEAHCDSRKDEICVLSGSAFENIKNKTLFIMGEGRCVDIKGREYIPTYYSDYQFSGHSLIPILGISKDVPLEQLLYEILPNSEAKDVIEAYECFTVAYDLSQIVPKRIFDDDPTSEEIHTSKERLTVMIKLWKKALSVYSKAKHPDLYAIIQNNLGCAYSDIAKLSHRRSRKKYFEEAVFACQEALSVYTEKELSESYFLIQNNIAKAYACLSFDAKGKEKREELQEKVTSSFEKSLEHYDCYKHPDEYMEIQSLFVEYYLWLASIIDDPEESKKWDRKAQNMYKALHKLNKELYLMSKVEAEIDSEADLKVKLFQRFRDDITEAYQCVDELHTVTKHIRDAANRIHPHSPDFSDRTCEISASMEETYASFNFANSRLGTLSELIQKIHYMSLLSNAAQQAEIEEQEEDHS